MSEYQFTLKFAIPDVIARETLEDRLFNQGCDDALIGTGHPGRLALAFEREASNAEQAVHSAIAAVEAAVPGARLVEVDPDLVGVSELAERLQCSRQNVRKLIQTHRASFPLPVHEGQSSLWHLCDVLDWAETHHGRMVEPTLHELARVNMIVNAAREVARVEPRAADQNPSPIRQP